MEYLKDLIMLLDKVQLDLVSDYLLTARLQLLKILLFLSAAWCGSYVLKWHE